MADLVLPNTIVNGQLGDATAVQQNFAAIVAWLNTNLIRSDGTVAMAAPLALPGNPSDNLQAAPKQYVDAAIPVGFLMPAARATAPSSLWLLCDGAAVSRSTYAALFTAISTAYGAGDGSTTFNLPSLQGRVPVGRWTGNTAVDTLGEMAGAYDTTLPQHRHLGADHLHNDDHYHTGATAGMNQNTTHSHPIGGQDATGNAGVGITSLMNPFGGTTNTTVATNTDHAHTFTTNYKSQQGFGATTGAADRALYTDYQGGAATNANMQPYTVVNYFIKVL